MPKSQNYARLAQLAERAAVNRKAIGSNPISSVVFYNILQYFTIFYNLFYNNYLIIIKLITNKYQYEINYIDTSNTFSSKANISHVNNGTNKIVFTAVSKIHCEYNKNPIANML